MRNRVVSTGAVLLLLGPPALLAFLLFFVTVDDRPAAAGCNPTGTVEVRSDAGALPGVDGYDASQLGNAADIVRAGSDLGLHGRDISIGVMTAIGESGLRVLDHGDAVGPDSRGLFQQRADGAWGSYAQRMDPYRSATAFFEALRQVEGRDGLSPTVVAHRVQRNADPYHYARHFADAVRIVEALTGADLGITQADGGLVCSGIDTGAHRVGAGGWAVPGQGPITSSFGMRINPVTGIRTLHAGTDLAAGGCDGSIWAAQAGVVTVAGTSANGTGMIEIDHGHGVRTRYLHMWPHGILVHVGQEVVAGDPVGLVGNSGNSTGCHLHYEVHVDGAPTDPVPYMARVGAPLG